MNDYPHTARHIDTYNEVYQDKIDNGRTASAAHKLASRFVLHRMIGSIENNSTAGGAYIAVKAALDSRGPLAADMQSAANALNEAFNAAGSVPQ